MLLDVHLNILVRFVEPHPQYKSQHCKAYHSRNCHTICSAGDPGENKVQAHTLSKGHVPFGPLCLFTKGVSRMEDFFAVPVALPATMV